MVALITSAVSDAPLYRLTVAPAATNGLKSISQVMVDKIMAYPRVKCGPEIGHLSGTDMVVMNSMLSVMIGLAD